MRRVVIMQGLTGAGKTTLVKALYPETDNVVCSADKFFESTPWNPRLLDQAHDECWDTFSSAIQANASRIVVDNTNLKFVDYEPYILEALDADYSVVFFTVLCPPQIAARRSKHWRQLRKQDPTKFFEKHDALLNPPKLPPSNQITVVRLWSEIPESP